jgi:patatin-like phospholipase domain-containing protein 4
MSLQNDTLIDVPKAIAYKIVETSSYLGLSISGKCLNIALNTSDKITSTLEPYVMPVIAHLKKYFKNSSLATPKKIQFYQVRNQVLEIIQLGLFAIHKEPTNPTEYIENEQLLNSYHIYASGKQSEELNFTFVGSGWLLFYELGVAKCLLQNIQPDILEYCNFTGSGTGSIIAALLVLKLNLGEIERKLIEIVTGLSKKLLGPVGCLSTIWRGFLIEVIPDFDDLDHRLLISLTKFPTFENVVINDIKNKVELIDCLLASCYIPILFESPVRVKGQMFVGGDLSKGMSSGTEENLTISTSPQPGQANICPSTIKYTAIQEVFPTDKENVLTEMVLDGYTDARSWLLRMNRAHGLPDRLFRTDFLTKPNSIEQ